MSEMPGGETERIPIKSPAGMVEVSVMHVSIDEKDPMANMVLLTDKNKRVFMPIWIGVYEGNEITRVMNSEISERPGIYQLMHNTLESLNANVDRVIISDMRGTTFIAQVVIKGATEIIMDSRPSDAICLAYWFEATIFVKDEVLTIAAYPDSEKISDAERTQGYIRLE